MRGFNARMLGDLGVLMLMLAASIALFIAAVWFGLHVIAPSIGRALDRAEAEDEEPSDRVD